ncbi:hypothetical protein LEP1GSC062_3491 [Leptospira alexanderi serovar Manhao 3 str. L 60]|uniref:Transposase n=1 Tax=Leptospira alexanderi serovar Manhao 3 str. L 60 TaxID=1049759 RepID=V6IDJ7_9LEPT|nr:hypothetical protein LEP1GSC062_3491 [Leptospira alexanderi serovar Manhao 3 str. L 60]
MKSCFEVLFGKCRNRFYFYSSLHNRVSKILRLNVGFVLKLTVLYFIGIGKSELDSVLSSILQYEKSLLVD